MKQLTHDIATRISHEREREREREMSTDPWADPPLLTDAASEANVMIESSSSELPTQLPHYWAMTETQEVLDVKSLVLSATRPPVQSSFATTVEQLMRHESQMHHFKNLFQRTAMHPFLLRFHFKYEDAFVHYLNKIATRRIRYTLSIGTLVVFGKYLYIYVGKTTLGNDDDNEEKLTSVLYLHFGLSLPVLLTGVVCTMWEELNGHYELYTSLVFLVVTVTLLMEKILLDLQGPILSLFVMFIPVFGITRLRFVSALSLASSMFLLYIVVVTSFGTEHWSVVSYQGFNYLAVIVGGAVAHYRQEVLRRRNYMLYLPVDASAPVRAHDIFCEIKKPEFKKSHVLHRWTLKFKNQEIEDVFYRFWYLMDPHPFAHPNAGDLHAGAYRSIRYAVTGVICGQFLLALQDRQFIHDNSKLAPWVYDLSCGLRFGLVIPSYAASGLCMYFLGRRYYRQWQDQTVEEQDQVHTPCSSSLTHFELDIDDDAHPEVVENGRLAPLKWEKGGRASRFPPQKIPNYVRVMQIISAFIVFVHGLAMGVILISLSSDGEENTAEASAPATYYLGLLNAIVFTHRSGFRVRFRYATASSVVLSLVFLSICAAVTPIWVPEYASYVCLTVILGMMFSYEEETLRRTFFMRKAVRIHEFNQWYDGRRHLDHVLRQWIRKTGRKKEDGEEANVDPKGGNDPKVKKDGHMSHASKYGTYFETGKVLLSGIFEAV